jgi:hypothetical protein
LHQRLIHTFSRSSLSFHLTFSLLPLEPRTDSRGVLWFLYCLLYCHVIHSNTVLDIHKCNGNLTLR